MPRHSPTHVSLLPKPGAIQAVLTTAACLGLLLIPLPPLLAASPLLESVKQNPALAAKLCGQFKQLNANGRSATSKDSIAAVASSQGLSAMDAEVLIIYLIGLNCSTVW